MKDDKNQIIRSMKSYEVGGATDDVCTETVMVDGKPKKRKKKGGCKQTFGRRSIPEGVKKVAKAAAVIGGGAIAYAKNAFGVKDKVKELMGQKTGGSVKMQKGGSMFKPAPKRKMTVNTIPVKKSKYTTPPRKIQMAQSGGTASSTFADSERRMASPARPKASGVDNMTTNTTSGQKLDYKKGGTAKRKMQVGGVAKRPTLSARIKPVVKAVKTVKATVKRRG